MDAQTRALELVTVYDEELRRLLPEGADIFDAHLHLGHDIDGMVGDYDRLEALMARYGISRAFMFCLDEPDRHPGFRAANDRTLAFAERSNGRLIPFVRLDLNESPIEEAKRCLDLGRPRDQAAPARAEVHRRATRGSSRCSRSPPSERVPILIHGGRGLPPIADGLRGLVDRHPGATLIIAHCGIADLGALAAAMAGRKGVLFDTSVWSPIDLLDFYRQIPPEQVVYASDYPYGQQPASLLIALKTAQLAGYTEAQIRAMLAGNANALADGDELPTPTQPVGLDTLRAADAARPHPPVPLDGDAAALVAPARHGRRPRPRDRGLLRA